MSRDDCTCSHSQADHRGFGPKRGCRNCGCGGYTLPISAKVAAATSANGNTLIPNTITSANYSPNYPTVANPTPLTLGQVISSASFGGGFTGQVGTFGSPYRVTVAPPSMCGCQHTAIQHLGGSGECMLCACDNLSGNGGFRPQCTRCGHEDRAHSRADGCGGSVHVWAPSVGERPCDCGQYARSLVIEKVVVIMVPVDRITADEDMLIALAKELRPKSVTDTIIVAEGEGRFRTLVSPCAGEVGEVVVSLAEQKRSLLALRDRLRR